MNKALVNIKGVTTIITMPAKESDELAIRHSEFLARRAALADVVLTPLQKLNNVGLTVDDLKALLV